MEQNGENDEWSEFKMQGLDSGSGISMDDLQQLLDGGGNEEWYWYLVSSYNKNDKHFENENIEAKKDEISEIRQH